MEKFIETERLLLREILPTDVDGFFELDSDPEVHRYLGSKPLTSKEQIVEVIEMIRQQYIDHGIGRWAVIDKNTNEFMGWSGLKWMTTRTNNHIHYYDLGYRLKKKFWGQGIATGTSLLFLHYEFETLNASEVYAMANIENIGSNQVLKKAGLTCMDTFDFEGILHH
jgi:RimJ/RimL family protein N-acetyltransferase